MECQLKISASCLMVNKQTFTTKAGRDHEMWLTDSLQGLMRKFKNISILHSDFNINIFMAFNKNECCTVNLSNLSENDNGSDFFCVKKEGETQYLTWGRKLYHSLQSHTTTH